MRDFFLYGAYFATYEKLKEKVQNPNKFHQLLFGGIAGINGWIFGYAFDNIKTRIQSDSLESSKNSNPL